MYYESELYHHGIKGQKWGKRNGPPYPLERKEKRKQKDLNRLNKYVEKTSQSIKKRNDSAKTIFMPNGKMYTATTASSERAVNRNANKVDRLVNKFSKKYDDFGYKTVQKNGKAYVETHIDDLKTTTVSELYLMYQNKHGTR